LALIDRQPVYLGKAVKNIGEMGEKEPGFTGFWGFIRYIKQIIENGQRDYEALIIQKTSRIE